MTLDRTTRASGELITSTGLTFYVEYEYSASAPEQVMFSFEKDDAYVTGNYSVVESSITNYSISGGIVNEADIKSIETKLGEIKEGYNTI